MIQSLWPIPLGYYWLVPLGLVLGALGTLIGAGGGFILVPVLLLLYPQEHPEIITSISLAVVFINGLSGAVAYARMKRIDYKSGLLFSATTIPGAIAGALTVAYVPRRLFDIVFGVLMICMAVLLMLQSTKRQETDQSSPAEDASGSMVRNVMEANGTAHIFSYNPVAGAGLSLFIGYFASLLGIGGGAIQVPMLVHALNFPVHVATATSQFILAIMASTSTVVHILRGAFYRGIRRAILLSIGAVLGAQLGARLSTHVRGEWIIRVLAITLGLIGVQILITVL